MSIIVSSDLSLDRDVDVMVNVSKAQVETTTDLSVTVFVTPDADVTHGAERIRFYNNIDELKVDFASTQEAFKAGSAFFSQSPRALTLAVGKTFTTAQAGYMRSKGFNSTLSDWTSVSDGSFAIAIDGVANDITGVDFSAATSFDDIAAILQTEIQLVVASTLVVNESSTFRFTSPTTGDSSTISALLTVSPASGTDVSGSGFINAQDDPGDPSDNVIKVDGYTPTGNIQDELDLIALAATASGKFVYAYVLDASYRDSSDQTDAASWMEPRLGILGLALNSPLVLDPNSTTDIGSVLSVSGNKRTFSVYHDNAYYYPEAATLSRLLSVNYNAESSTMTAKFKDLVGIPTVGITSTDLSILLGKRVNTFTAVGNSARTFREGQNASPSFFIDDLINLDNYEEQLEVEVYNVLLQNKKIPYTPAGVALLHGAIDRISDRFVFNGTFAEREVEDLSGELNSPPIDPAYTITSTPLSQLTSADRAERSGPPFTVDVNLAGAIHSVSIQVNAFS